MATKSAPAQAGRTHIHDPHPAAKTRRWEARVTPEADDKIKRAMAVVNLDRTEFLTDAALEKADRILARADVTFMDNALFDDLLTSLDTPDEAPALDALAAMPRRSVRR